MSESPDARPRVTLGWVFPRRHDQVGAVRTAVRQTLPTGALSGERRDDVELVAGELAANSVNHARGEKFAVELALARPTRLELTVHDDGGDTVPTSKPLVADFDETAGAEPEAPALGECGRGLLLVETCSGSWGYTADENGCATWACFDLADPIDTLSTVDGADIGSDFAGPGGITQPPGNVLRYLLGKATPPPPRLSGSRGGI